MQARAHRALSPLNPLDWPSMSAAFARVLPGARAATPVGGRLRMKSTKVFGSTRTRLGYSEKMSWKRGP